MNPGQKVWSSDSKAVGVVLIAEGDLAYVEIGDRICRFNRGANGVWARDYYQPSDGKIGHDELSLLND